MLLTVFFLIPLLCTIRLQVSNFPEFETIVILSRVCKTLKKLVQRKKQDVLANKRWSSLDWGCPAFERDSKQQQVSFDEMSQMLETSLIEYFKVFSNFGTHSK